MRRRKGARALGPYPDRDGFRIRIIAGDGETTSCVVATEAEANEVIAELTRGFALEEVTVDGAIDMYKRFLVEDRGRRPSSVIRCMAHLRAMFPDRDLLLTSIGPRQAEALYVDMRTRENPKTKKPVAVDTHRNALNECSSFGRWAVKRKLLTVNPFADVEPVGKRKHGKPQLRIDEARKLLDVTAGAAQAGDLGALATALLLLTALRASELAMLVGRDVDDGGHLLWIDESKTPSGKRRVEIPEGFVEALKSAAKGGGPLWPKQNRYWVSRQSVKWCKRAGVPRITPHGQRGTHSTLAQDSGATSHIVAAALGHGVAINQQAYTEAGTAARANARRVMQVIQGGRK